MHRFFHTIVIVGASVTSSCGESHENVFPDAGSKDASLGNDASQDAQKLADRVIEDAEVMRDAAKDASNPCVVDGSWNEDSCPLIR